MKKVLIALMVLVSLCVKAQHTVNGFTIQPQIGGDMATLTDGDKKNKMKPGFVAGLELEYQASDILGVTVGVQYSMQGTGVKNTGPIKLDYLNIPIRAKVYVAHNFSLNAGGQLGFQINAKWDEVYIRNKTIDFSIPLGVSYEISNVVIDARYNLGLTKVFDDKDSKNSVLMMTVGYRFDL